MSCLANETCINSSSVGTASQLFASALQFFALAQCHIKTDSPPDISVCDLQQFDYIIVGAGSAGCVVANRLTEDENVTVLLLEAGDDAPVETRVPGFEQSLYNTKYDWGYLTTNDGRSNQANINGSISWHRGKVLGGSSNINAMWYIKGVYNDYEAWYKAGNKYWHPNILQKYFKKAESFQYMELLNNPYVDQEYGHKGLLVINRFNSTYRHISDNVIDSWNELGIQRVVDLNLPGTFKSGNTSVTAANGERQSADIAYFFPIQKRPNLKFLKTTLVTKVLLNKYKRCYGVEVERNGGKMVFYAKLEVIISAGTINTPQLLMLSGIGPIEHLTEKNIDCKVNSPMVGQNLQDHHVVPVTIYGDGPTDPLTSSKKQFEAIQYLYNRTGYLAQNVYLDISAFYASSRNIDYPEYQNFLNLIWKNSSTIKNVFKGQLRFKEPIPSSIAELNKRHVLYLFQFALLHPLSRGNISLRTNNPKDHPLIYPNYFSNLNDLDSAATGIKILTDIVKTAYFKSINGFLGRISWPACNNYELDSEEYWKCISINLVSTLYHPVGTSKMGPDPATSVVDSRLRVHGVDSLRVIDASIMPTITSGNINGPTMMIAERGADLVKEDRCELRCDSSTNQ